jgi:hypothetical protein
MGRTGWIGGMGRIRAVGSSNQDARALDAAGLLLLGIFPFLPLRPFRLSRPGLLRAGDARSASPDAGARLRPRR